MPTQAERNGDLTALGGPVIPPASINPTAKALLSYYPLPNVTGQSNYNYENFQSTPARTDGADIRIDQTINSKQSVYARFSRKNITADYANPFLPNDADSIHNRSLLVSHTYTHHSAAAERVPFRLHQCDDQRRVSPSRARARCQQLDLTGVNISQHPTTHAFPTFNFSAGTGFTPIGRDKTGSHAVEDDCSSPIT